MSDSLQPHKQDARDHSWLSKAHLRLEGAHMGKSIISGVTRTWVQILPPPLACSELLLLHPSNMADPECWGASVAMGLGQASTGVRT